MNFCVFFIANFVQMVQKILTSGNCVQFPDIPAKFRESFTEKTAISFVFQEDFEKICKNHQNSYLRKCENFEMYAVQKSVHLVELEKCCKM